MEESIAAPSEESIMLETPSEPVEPTTPVESTEPVEPTEPTVELFELPDGRKVDGAGVLNEYINLQKDYTHKSQTLAEIEKSKLPIESAKNIYDDPNYVPKTYGELIETATQTALTRIAEKEEQRVAANQAIENEVEGQLSDVKKLDPTVNENALFLHATKYGFRNLKIAHQNMKDMADMAKKVQTTTVANIAKRNDPVSITPGASGSRPDPSQFRTSQEYLRSLK